MIREFIEPEEFSRLFRENFTLLDVRSEGEFSQSTVPDSVNIPLLRNDERAAVGTTYRHDGQDAAIAVGNHLVSGATRAERISAWSELLQDCPRRALFCARGGLRSKISQEWLRESGVETPRVRGGYKELRNYFMRLCQELPEQFSFFIIGGPTGSGKTTFLNSLATPFTTLDLEAVARHRGSAFGDVYGGQPTQRSFENSLAVELLRRSESHSLVVEAESKRIGRHYLPEQFWARMSQGQILLLEVPLEERVENILSDYIQFMTEKFQSQSPEHAPQLLEAYLLNALLSLHRHLGGERTKRLSQLIQSAIVEQRESGSIHLHRDWIRTLLDEYYDPHYEKHLERSGERIVFSGPPESVRQKLGSLWEEAERGRRA